MPSPAGLIYIYKYVFNIVRRDARKSYFEQVFAKNISPLRRLMDVATYEQVKQKFRHEKVRQVRYPGYERYNIFEDRCGSFFTRFSRAHTHTVRPNFL